MESTSKWTDKYAILRDLSVAQGREVPVDINQAITAVDKPPALNIDEEIEEEYFEHCNGDGNFSVGPDLSSIKEMLELIRDFNCHSESNADTKEAGVNKPSCTVSEDIPVVKNHTMQIQTRPVQKIRLNKNRNVAVESLLKASNTSSVEPLKLLKPNDFIQKNDSTEAIEKVNTWLNNNNKKIMPMLTTSMFKKKTKVPTEPMPMEPIKKPSCQKDNTYVPSKLATEYYNKFLERNKTHLAQVEDIWTKAEREMKELDAKRKVDAAQKSSDLSNSSSTSDSLHGIDAVRLPMHRHLLTDDCIVCKMLCKRKDTPSGASKFPLDDSSDLVFE